MQLSLSLSLSLSSPCQNQHHLGKTKEVLEFNQAIDFHGVPHKEKFNIAPEKWWLEDEFPFGIAYF